MKTIYLIRHAEAGEDRADEVQHTPINMYDRPLTIEGISQASKLSKVFENISIDRSYTSDYLRAKETFEQLNVQHSPHMVLPQIREIFCELIGVNLGNRDLAEFAKQISRVKDFVNNHIATMCDNETILIVAHGCFNLFLLYQLVKKSFGHEMAHTGVTKLVYDGGWDFEYFNNTSHLFDGISSEIQKMLHNEI